MGARDRAPAMRAALAGSADFDELGALLFAIRTLTEGAQPPERDEWRHLYSLTAMAEAAWSRLDSADGGAGPKR